MVVRMRANRSKTGMRRSHAAISGTRLSRCECGADKIPHRACAVCGKYNGKIIIDIVARAKREQRRIKRHEKELKESGKEIKEKETSEKT